MTNTLRLRVLALLASGSAFTLLALQACSGDNAGGDAGPDATTGDASQDVVAKDVAQDVVQTNDAACPTYTGSVEFCKAAVARCNACPGTTSVSTCQRQNFDAVCSGIANIFSTQFQNALNACATTCDQDAETACQRAELADASLTSAQQKVATDYCSHCATDAGCAAALAAQINLIEIADPLATTIDNSCTPDAGPDSGSCGVAFEGCALGILSGSVKTLPCADAAAD